jgi:hypothetical protein
MAPQLVASRVVLSSTELVSAGACVNETDIFIRALNVKLLGPLTISDTFLGLFVSVLSAMTCRLDVGLGPTE